MVKSENLLPRNTTLAPTPFNVELPVVRGNTVNACKRGPKYLEKRGVYVGFLPQLERGIQTTHHPPGPSWMSLRSSAVATLLSWRTFALYAPTYMCLLTRSLEASCCCSTRWSWIGPWRSGAEGVRLRDPLEVRVDGGENQNTAVVTRVFISFFRWLNHTHDSKW